MNNSFDWELVDDPRWTLSGYVVQETTEPPTMVTDAAPLEQFPHIITKLQYLWGYPEVTLYLESLVINTDPNRPIRRGFDPVVKSDILFLYNLFIDQFSIVNRDKNATTPFAYRREDRKADVWDFSR